MSKPIASHEKRIHPRKVLRTQVLFEDETGEGFIYFYSTDVSTGGIFLESDIPLEMGTMVSLQFHLGEGYSPIRTAGRVVRVEKQPHDTLPVVGMGLQFDFLSEEQKKALADFTR